MKQFAKLFIATALTAVLSVFSAAQAWGEDTTVSYGWENSDDASAWTITDAIVKTSGQGNTGTYAGRINTNHTYVQFNSKVYVKSFSFAFKRTSTNSNYNVYIETSTDGTNWTAVETYTMGSFNNGSYTTKTKSFDGTKEYYVRFHCYNTTAVRYVDDVTITYTEGSGTPTCATPTFSPAAGAYASAQNVTISTTTEDATIYYTTNGTEPTTSSSVYSTAIPVSATTTIKAIAAKEGLNNSPVASATYSIIEHAGTEADPYTVADAIAAIDANVGVTNVYVSGIVSTGGDSVSSGAITYKISDDGTKSNELQIYRGKGLNGANFTSADEIQVKDEVVVKGDLTKYNNTTYQFNSGSQLASFNRPAIPSVTLSTYSVDATWSEKEGTIGVTYNNLTDILSEVVFLASDGVTSATYDWLVAEIKASDNTKLDYLLSENTGTEARTAYLKVYALGDEGDAYSNLVTVSQAGYVVDYATLPFSFDSGSNSIASTTGLTQSGLGSDYGSSPKLKFDTTGDYLILKINEQPGVLSFDIKGNSFSGGTFTVQTSADGVSYSDKVSYTSIGDVSSKEIDNLDASVRYIKWVYTKKSSGNVALGNISLAKPSSGVSIVPSTYSVAVPAQETNGTITITYNNITNIEADVFFCDSEGNSATYDWLDADINNSNNLYYTVNANLGAARTAYLKVYALDDESNVVYSELITISQEKYVEPEIPGNWVLTNLADLTPNDVFVIVGDNTDTYAMSNDKGTSAPDAVEVNVQNNTLTVEVPEKIQWNIDGNASDGYVFYPNGSTQTWLYCINNNDGVRVGTGDAKHFTLEDGYLTTSETNEQRYVGIYNSKDWRCYTVTTGNIAGQTFSFFKKVVDAPATINITATEADGRYWATFYTAAAHYALPEGAQAFTMGSDNKLYRVGADGSVIPAGKAVVIIADTQNLTLSVKNAKADVTLHGGTNILLGSDSAVSVSGITSGTPYVLGIVGGKIGFYKFTGESIPARKAYYVVND